MAEAWIHLRIKTWIKMQSGGDYERAKEFAGSLSRHRRPESIGISIPTLSKAGGRIISLAKCRAQHRPTQGMHGTAVIHEQLEFLPARERLFAGSDIGKHNGLFLQQIIQVHARYLFWRSRLRWGRRGRSLIDWTLASRSLTTRTLTSRTRALRLLRLLTECSGCRQECHCGKNYKDAKSRPQEKVPVRKHNERLLTDA